MPPKAILISGASSGIGFSLAQRLAQQGWRVFGGVRNACDSQRLAAMGVTPLLLDVTRGEQIEEAVAKIKDECGNLDALVNNAGVALGGPLECVALADYRYQFEVNFFGTVALIQSSLPLLRKKGGRIVNMSSISGLISFPGLSPYCSSKFAVEAMSDSLRSELRPFGVKVILVEPGPVKTPIWEKSVALNREKMKLLAPELQEIYRSQIQNMESNFLQSAERAIKVDKVVDCVETCLKARSPKARYLVGPQVKATVGLLNLLPTRVKDVLFSVMLDKA